ncbi:MAG: COG3014 family protein [Pseudomonadota bacterium]
MQTFVAFRAILILAAALLSGCAATSVFNPYPNQALAFRQATSGLDTAGVLLKLDSKRAGADGMLYMMERGRIDQLQGDYAASKADFEQAIAGFEAASDKARLSLSGVGAGGISMFTNDNALPYKGQAYERVMVHQFQAFNYLGLGDIEGATVELRRAQQVQREQELKYAEEIAKAQSEAEQKSVFLGEFDQYFTGMDGITGTLKNSFQNGYSFYTAAVIREAIGEYNDALVDYKKALELAPGNAQLRADVIRANEYFDGKAARVATGKNGKPAARTPAGTVVVLFEQGFVPAKKPVGLAIPTTDGGIFSIQFPVYDGTDYTPPAPLTVRLPDGSSGQTEVLVNTGALAVKSLREQIPALLLRQVLRARAKYEMQKKAAEQGGVFGQLAANIYNMASEQADLRSWLTLPANAQALRLSVPAGMQNIELVSGMGSLSVPVDVKDRKTTIIRAVEVNGRLITQTFAL